MPEKKGIYLLTEAMLCSFGLMFFSFFIHYHFPLKLLSFAALLLPAFIISRNLTTVSDLKRIIDDNHSFIKRLLYIISGIASGFGISILYRWHLDLNLIPRSFHQFFITAGLIGCMEELVFRGFIQEFVKKVNGPVSILFSTLSHTGYKCCLFLSPAISENIDIGWLVFWTFSVGLLFGAVRHFTKSLLPSLTGHALFDILVYAEFATAPWWVW